MRNRIPNYVKWLMLTVALVYDILSFIPIVNIVVWILTPITFGIWFLLLHAGFVGFINTKKLKGDIIIYLFELVPFLSMVPGVTIRVHRAIKMIQEEDGGGSNKKPGVEKAPKTEERGGQRTAKQETKSVPKKPPIKKLTKK